ncbi:hypothetical protein GF378_00600 [Candidatus Pacearchaeota archaeon]|nr:hypothetical protein [Candidatus Pacearchaeota archaeon]
MSSDKKKIRAIFMMEVLGKPPEHLKKTLENISEKLNQEKEVEVKEKEIHDAKELEKKKGFYTCFSEIEFETDSIVRVVGLMFKYMPAHIEIISPEKISLNNNDFTMLFNELARRLHAYDEVTRVAQAQRNKLAKKLKEVMGSEESENSNKKEKKSDKKSSKKKEENSKKSK